jgi:hypothetical protein
MNDPERIRLSSHLRMNFTWKIILIATALLACSQILGTLISVSTFETLLLNTLTAKYEILGNDLKRKIEHSLKFGKSLDHFMGMEKLIAPVYQQTDDIGEIMIFDKQGALFFFSKRADPPMAGDEAQAARNCNLFLVDSEKNRVDLPVQYFSTLPESDPKMQLYNGKYHVLFSILPSLGSKPGILALTFPKSVLDRQTERLINSTGKKLLLSLVITAAVMGIMIHLLFTRPSRQLSDRLIRSIQARTPHPKTDSSSNGNSLLHLYDLITAFQANTREAKNALRHTLHELSKQGPDTYTADSINRIQLVLEREQDETD